MSSYFVKRDSIVREIWGKADTILFIFAGASAEFALNKSVDWLYFTGKLPADPLGRLFSTVGYARQIIFSDNEEALRSIDKITAIHKGVEASRGAQIPDEAYLEVLFMLIDYSIRSYELLEHKLLELEKAEVFEVFYRVGKRMGLAGLPSSYHDYEIMRKKQLADNLYRSQFSLDLYRQYRKHLGPVRYLLLKQAQVLVAPARVNQLLRLGKIRWLLPVLYVYKIFRLLKLQNLLKNAILPNDYQKQVQALDIAGHH
ncbi:MAG TPA: oxygenase MpaB family protein [Mucilaginibacter sp.]|nr:oxygenase MpaB family protein [Mucilaginibacter sp.]